MFSSESQLSRVCRAFCARAKLAELWTDEGPTAQAVELAEHDGGFLSSGERLMLLVAWSIWNGNGTVRVTDVLYQLDSTSLALFGKLLVAAARGGDAIDAWIAEAERPIQQRKSGRA